MRTFAEIGISLDELLAKMGSLVQVIDGTGRLHYANSHWLNTLEYDTDSLTALRFQDDILAQESVGIFQAMTADLLGGKDLQDISLTLRTRSGREVHVEGSLIPRHTDDQLVAVVGVFRDVTEHLRMEDELQRAFELSEDLLGTVNFDGHFAKVNPAWKAVLGYDPDEIIGQNLEHFIHPDDLERTRVAAVHLLENLKDQPRSSTLFENRYRCKTGEYRWLSWSVTAYRDRQQTYFVARDITERKRTEDQLDEANRQLRAILDNSGALIYMKDVHGRYILVNREFETFFGLMPEEVLGKTDHDLFEDRIANLLESHDTEALQSPAMMQFEETLPGTGGVRTYLANKFTLTTPGGEAYAVCSISTDITYRKLTEMQLLLRNQAIEFSPSGISIADATLPDMPLIYINPAFEKNTGYSALDTIGRNCRFLQGDDRDQPGIEEIRAALREERPCTVTLRNYTKSGKMFYNELRLAPIRNSDGQLTHYVGISTDVTERVKAAEKITQQNAEITQQNAALVKANRALASARKQAEDATRLKSQFLATMSHELRTPLNAIIGYTEIQLAGMTGQLTDEQSDYQRRVLANAEHLLSLINDVLDIAKIEAGRIEIVNKPFDLGKWLDDVVLATRVQADEKGLEMIGNLDERLPKFIVGDAARIKQIAINLVGNAIKFTSTGHIRIQVRKHGRDAWKLIVSDTGMGIPSHLLETVFEEFRQVDSSSQRKQGGTGLGLSIVRKLALMMGGNVRVSSQLGVGTTFTVILPLIESDTATT